MGNKPSADTRTAHQKAMVVTISNRYGNLICLETTDHGQPFTALENWLNQLSNADLASEDLPITR